MITACTVILEGMEAISEVLIKSLTAKSYLVSKILIAVKTPKKIDIKKQVGNIEIEIFNFDFYEKGYCHALGLHHCIDRVKTPFILFTDPDVIYFLDNFDSFYMNLYEKDNLNIVGATHYNFEFQAFYTFPTVINCLVKRDTLPDENFLKGELRLRDHINRGLNKPDEDYKVMNGKYLLQTPIERHIGKFPRPNEAYDIGCNLWLWNKRLNGRWIAFHHQINLKKEIPAMRRSKKYFNCNTKNFNNIESNDDFGNLPLLYHGKLSAHDPIVTCEKLKTQFELSLMS